MPFQKFNRKIGAWVKFKTLKNGRTRIINVKETKPRVSFKGVPRK